MKLSLFSRSIFIFPTNSMATRRLDTRRMNNLIQDFDVGLFPEVKRVYGLQQHRCMRSSRRGTRTRDAAGRQTEFSSLRSVWRVTCSSPWCRCARASPNPAPPPSDTLKKIYEATSCRSEPSVLRFWRVFCLQRIRLGKLSHSF